jgi:metallo-beta-lactamase class B
MMSRVSPAVAFAAGLAAPFALAAQAIHPVAPFRIADNLYFVGNSYIGVYLITGSEGDILLDVGYDYMVPQVISSIEELGFDVDDVRIILNSHAHYDHAGGIAEMKERTGAQFLASAPDVPLLERGGVRDPVYGDTLSFPPVHPDRVLSPGEVVRLGDIEMVANLTPGHTAGCTSWSMRVMADGGPRTAVFICSLSLPAGTRLTGSDASYPGIADDYRTSFEVLRGLGCEVFLGSHSIFFGLERKLAVMKAGAEVNPFIDAEGCSAFVDNAERAFERQLSAEGGGP